MLSSQDTSATPSSRRCKRSFLGLDSKQVPCIRSLELQWKLIWETEMWLPNWFKYSNSPGSILLPLLFPPAQLQTQDTYSGLQHFHYCKSPQGLSPSAFFCDTAPVRSHYIQRNIVRRTWFTLPLKSKVLGAGTLTTVFHCHLQLRSRDFPQ